MSSRASFETHEIWSWTSPQPERLAPTCAVTAQAVVAADSLLVVATDVVQAANDKQQLEPMVEKLKALPEELGQVATLLADNGYFSAANVTTCEATNIVPLIATGAPPVIG